MTVYVVFATIMFVFLLSALGWMIWLYIDCKRELVRSNRDRNRLLGRLGMYHDIPLGVRADSLPNLPPEASIPPAFRMKKPRPIIPIER